MKRGFTLIELLAVIVILAIISLIAVPIVINIISDAKKSSQEESFNLYAKAIENGVVTYLLKHPTVNPETLTMEDIKDYVKYSGEKTDCEILQIGTKGNIYLSDCKVDNTKVEYEYGNLIKPIVSLTQGLTPVIYDEANEKWIVVDKNDPNWYDYDEQKWANAIVLGTDVTKQVGDEVKVDGTEAKMMLVYIPRYEYKIEGQFGKGGRRADLPGEIEVNFIGKNKTKATEGYHINNAFNFDGAKSGFWVGKFEISHETLSSNKTSNNLRCSTTSCTNASGLRILPNKESLRYNNVSNFWYAIKSIENTSSFGLTNMDTHMMKNSEWGAVAYLSQSKYGKYGNNDYIGFEKEIYINNSTYYYTGRSGGNVGGKAKYPKKPYTNSDKCYYGFYTYDGYLLDFNKNNKTEEKIINKGTGASTTGNIYGVYDMSGGAWEYVMGAYGTSTPKINDSGFGSTVFTGNTIESKYYDIYKTNNVSTACDNNGPCLGHAMSETASWYRDYAYMVSSSYPWFLRGGYCYSNHLAGVFFCNNAIGNSDFPSSARVVVFEK